MAVLFELAVATADLASAEAVARHMSGLDVLLGAPHAEVDGRGAGWVSVSIRGLGINVPGDDESIPLHTGEAWERIAVIHERLRTAPAFRCAVCAGEALDWLQSAEEDVVVDGTLAIERVCSVSPGVIVDVALHRALGEPPGYEIFAPGLLWRPPETTTPFAYTYLVANTGVVPRVDLVDCGELGWDEVPPDGKLFRLEFGDGVLYLHERRGRWSRMSTGPVRAPLRGVLFDALVFGAACLPERVDDMLREAREVPIEGGPSDGLAGSAVRCSGNVVRWGPFAYTVPRSAEEQILSTVSKTTTVVLHAIDSLVGGPDHTVIVHHPGDG